MNTRIIKIINPIKQIFISLKFNKYFDFYKRLLSRRQNELTCQIKMQSIKQFKFRNIFLSNSKRKMISQTIISLVGWLYFLSWSFSFYGQFLLNFKLKKVQGMNLDYLHMGLIGFTFYSIYSSYGYFYNKAQIETGKVFLNDLVFSYHAFIITLLTVVQTFIYPKGENKINKITIVFLSLLCLFVVIYSILTYGFHVISPYKYYTLISFLGYFIIILSFLKYWPQMIWNFARKSTLGWSVFNIFFDLTGGICCLIQMSMVYYNHGHTDNVNTAKLILSIMCIVYNLVFIIQHYYIYPRSITTKVQELNKGPTERILDKVQIITTNQSPSK